MTSIARTPSLLGMVHLRALPGTPFARASVHAIVAAARDEAKILANAGFDGIIVENMHDRPYVDGPHGPETTAIVTRAALAVREAAPDLALGVQVLSSGHKEALAIALAVGASFIRVENFVYAHVADEGLMAKAVAGELLRYRRAIGAERVKIYADVKKKHASHAITGDISLAQCAHAAEFFGADGVIVTGAFTGDPTRPGDVAEAKSACRLPVLVGSGATPAQLGDLFEHADGVIVGSWIKKGGVWTGAVDAKRCREIVKESRRVRARRK